MAWLNGLIGGEQGARGHSRELQYLKSSIPELITAAVMMIDRDFLVTYVNQPTRDLFTKNLATFKKAWPGFDPDRIIGTCIDTFHKNPEHQRKILSDPSRLPLKTEITIGDLKIELLVSAARDRSGKYVGNVLEWREVTAERINAGTSTGISKMQAVIEFTMDGNVVTANENFLKAMGYSLDEIHGRHHGMFVDAAYRESPEYRAFWDKLRRGEYDAGQYRRVGKGGREVWIQAIYNPIVDMNGKPFKVIKFATDITPLRSALAQIQEVVSAAKNNDLTRRIPLEGKSGDTAQLCQGVNDLLDTMTRVVTDMKDASDEVSNASAEISASTTDLSQRTEEQAASLEQTSASMEQMSATVKKNAENAQEASALADTARQVADRGGEVIGAAVSSMVRIEESSKKISTSSA